MILDSLILGTFFAGAAALPAPDCTLVAGWRQEGPSRTYGPETLFDYVDGGAEAYRAYGFALLKGVTCVNDAGDRLVVDVSALRDADHAWGMFTAHRDPRSPTEAIGAAGQVLSRRATFARGRYYVEIAASPAGDHTAALRAFATALEAQTPGRARLPREVEWFPPEGLEAGSVRFVPQGVAGFPTLRRGFVARYPEGRAFLVPEESVEAAAAALGRIREHVEGGPDVPGIGDQAFTATDARRGGLVLFRRGVLVGGVTHLAEGADGTALAHRLAEALP